MKVGFLNNQIDNRGTGNAVYDYAHYNEEILGNESRIFTYENASHNQLAVQRYLQRFSQIIPIDVYKQATSGVDVLYHIKSGYPDGVRAPDGVRYAVHAVFNVNPHGDRYAAVSNWLSNGVVPYVPHIISLPAVSGNLRNSYGIPNSATVFGRHGGDNTFDIPFVYSAIRRVLEVREDVWFVFLNTTVDIKHPRVIFLEETQDPKYKVKFINTCNAMIHARMRGETFGISVGEFASLGKPVFTYNGSGERAHLEELDSEYFYSDEETLVNKMLEFYRRASWGYTQYTPENVMAKFKEVFLD